MRRSIRLGKWLDQNPNTNDQAWQREYEQKEDRSVPVPCVEQIVSDRPSLVADDRRQVLGVEHASREQALLKVDQPDGYGQSGTERNSKNSSSIHCLSNVSGR